MWPFRKDKPSPTPPITAPRSHRRITHTSPPVDVARWLLAEADQLDAEALAKETQAETLLSHAIEWRAVAAAKRALALTVPPPAEPDAFPPPAAYTEPEPEPQDPSTHNPTWQIPSPQQVSILTPWTPTPGADGAGWNDGSTGQFPLVNGEGR